ncbi:hypothetical protein AcV7_002119 [Taiwanofungus camphoratus]|nr:hypothetical protein AcV7_002119 [Antrodia cinnamomea]
MDSTPGLDSDTPHAPSRSASTMMPYGHSSASSSGQRQQSSEQTTHHQGQGQTSGPPKFSNGPHIRSRITVVCAECKRLKLKCDRRTPCSSCLKRDTVQRCVYSQAAAEKIDVQSLHNRIIVLETAIAQLTSASPSATISSVLSSLPPFKAPFTSSSMSLPNIVGARGHSAGSAGYNMLGSMPSNDRALLAIGASGSSVVISLEDVASIWLGELDDFNHHTGPSTNPDTSASPTRQSGAARVKLEPTPVLMPPASPLYSTSRSSVHTGRAHSAAFVPPIPYEAFMPLPSAPSTHVSTPANPYPPPPPQTNLTEPPQVTPALLTHLPPANVRGRYMKALRETMLLHPCFNVQHFEKRVEAMIGWGSAGMSAPGSSFDFSDPSAIPAAGGVSGSGSGSRSMEELARDLFFGTPAANGKSAKAKANGKEQGRTQQPSGSPKPTLSFFAATCAAFALGGLVARANDGEGAGVAAEPSSSSASHPPSAADAADVDPDSQRYLPGALYALSDQALSLFEKTSLYDLDSVIAMILQVLYHLHDGQMSVAQGVFPLVGKMINVARMMGLAIDPDEFPGTYSLFEAETRRRIWWDVFYYDLFISDCMGHPPLIPDNSFTTRLPANVDEDQFTPSSTTLPAAPGEEESEKGTAYFVLKCRLAQLVKNVKKQTFKDPVAEDPTELSIDQAAAFEAEVTTFLSELSPAFRLELNRDWSETSGAPSALSFLTAQKCELVILANRLILKLYLPFLKDASATPTSNKPSHQAVLGSINAAHHIIYASRILHSVWRHTRPAAFDFYDFGRTLFDAAVVCAHAVIQQPTTMVAAEAMKDVGCALDVMRELGVSKAGVEGVRGEGNRSEAIRIVDMMKRKAEAARSANSGGSVTAGTKRKRSPLGDDGLSSGFQLPFVGAAVASAKTGSTRSILPSFKSSNALTKETSRYDPKSKNDAKRQAKEKDKEKDKSTKYPSIGIRVRPGQVHPSSRQRACSTSSTTPSLTTPVGRVNPPTPGVGPSSSAHGQPIQSRPAAQDSPSVGAYDHYSSSRPSTHHGPLQESMQHDDYPMPYSANDDSGMVDRRRYSSQSYADSPQAASLFDQASLSQPSPATYSTGPTPPNYYLAYAPPSGPPPPSSYENATMGHPQSAAMAGLTAPTPIDTSSSGGLNPPIANIPHDLQYSAHEKPHPSSYGSHMSKPSDHTRQMTHEYQPPSTAQSLSMPSSHAQGWPQADPNQGGEMWSDYKFYAG